MGRALEVTLDPSESANSYGMYCRNIEIQAFRTEGIAFPKLEFLKRLQTTTLQNATPSAPNAYFDIFLQYLLADLRNAKNASEVLQT